MCLHTHKLLYHINNYILYSSVFKVHKFHECLDFQLFHNIIFMNGLSLGMQSSEMLLTYGFKFTNLSYS